MSKSKQTTMAEYVGALLKANERGHLAVPNKVCGRAGGSLC